MESRMTTEQRHVATSQHQQFIRMNWTPYNSDRLSESEDEDLSPRTMNHIERNIEQILDPVPSAAFSLTSDPRWICSPEHSPVRPLLIYPSECMDEQESNCIFTAPENGDGLDRRRYDGTTLPLSSSPSGEDLLRTRFRRAVLETELSRARVEIQERRNVIVVDQQLEEGEILQSFPPEAPQLQGVDMEVDDNDVPLLDLNHATAGGYSYRLHSVAAAAAADDDDDVITTVSEANRRGRCPSFCGCHDEEDATEHIIPTWERRTSAPEGEGGFFTHHNNGYTPIPTPANSEQIDPELENRTEYIYSVVRSTVAITAADHRVNPVLDARMHYRPLSTEHILCIEPPSPAWLTDLYSQDINIDEEYEMAIYGEGAEAMSVRSAAAHLIHIIVEVRTLIYSIMTVSNPKTYLGTHIGRLSSIMRSHRAADRLLWDLRPNCRRLEDALELSTCIASVVYRVLLVDCEDPHPDAEPSSTWTWNATASRIAEHLRHVQSDRFDTGVVHRVIELLHGDMADATDEANLQAAASVYEFCRFVVRGIDSFFSLLRMEPWALRRALNEESSEEDTGISVRLWLMPTMYDSVVEYE